MIDDALATSCTNCLGLRLSRQPPRRHPHRMPASVMTPAHELARGPLSASVRAISRSLNAAASTDPACAHLLQVLTDFQRCLRDIDT